MAAVARPQQFAGRYRYVHSVGILKHFASVDYAPLRETLQRVEPEDDMPALTDVALPLGAGVLDEEYRMCLVSAATICRPRGLLIGNLT